MGRGCQQLAAGGVVWCGRGGWHPGIALLPGEQETDRASQVGGGTRLGGLVTAIAQLTGFHYVYWLPPGVPASQPTPNPPTQQSLPAHPHHRGPCPQDIAAGEEVCISYGCQHKSNEELMRDYGFVMPANPNDRIPFATGARAPGWRATFESVFLRAAPPAGMRSLRERGASFLCRLGTNPSLPGACACACCRAGRAEPAAGGRHPCCLPSHWPPGQRAAHPCSSSPPLRRRLGPAAGRPAIAAAILAARPGASGRPCSSQQRRPWHCSAAHRGGGRPAGHSVCSSGPGGAVA